MAQWGRNDTAVTANSTTTKESSNGAPIGTYTLVKGDQINRVDGANAHFGNTSPGSRAYTDSTMFGNTTVGAFLTNRAVGVFAVNQAQLAVTGGNLAIGIVTSGGTGYNANAAVTLTVTSGGTGGVLNAHANVTSNAGRIDALNVQTPGSAYVTAPTVTIAAPATQALVPNTTGVIAATNFIKLTSANSYWQANDQLTYTVAAGNTAIGGLTANTTYYISFANTTGFVVSATRGGTNVTLTEARTGAAETGHTIQGLTATGYVDTNSVQPQVTHAGWVLRTEGTGGRAGRIHYETLVAMGSIGMNTTSSTGRTGNIDTVTSNTVDTYV